MKLDNLVSEFAKLFRGLDRAYGTYKVTKTEGNKKVGPRRIVQEPVTPELWKGHLTGAKGIGIIPINDESVCYFGAMDIDVYEGLDYAAIVKKIREYELPLVAFRSKSGGVHAFAFVSEPVPAKLMREKLSHWSAALGYGEIEIFPKQNEILTERGDVGNWINIPYFNAKKTDRYALDADGDAMSVDDFVSYVQTVRLTKAEFEKADVRLKGGIEDGPPCLEALITFGITEGKRNDGLFALGIYLKRARPDSWQRDIAEMNLEYFDPPLSGGEVDNIIKSLDKKDYSYSCNRQPLKGYCNSSLCRSRKFGVGTSVDMPKLTGLTKYNTQPPIWFLDVEDGGRLELTTEDLQNQGHFQKCCMESLNLMPPSIPRPAWVALIQELFSNVTIIEAPVDASPIGQLMETIEKFCTGKSQARDRSEVLLDKPWTEDGRTYFRVSALRAYLDKQGIREFKVNKITSILKQRGGKHEFWNIKGKGVNVWSLPAFAEQKEPFEAPDPGKGDVF
jgi:hypothetical protein